MIKYNGIITTLDNAFPYNTAYGNPPKITNNELILGTQAGQAHQGSSVILNSLPEFIVEDGLKIEIDLNCSGYYMTSSNLVISLLQRNTSYSGYDVYGISTLAKLISATFSREDPSKFSKIIIEVVSVVNKTFNVYDQNNNIIKEWNGDSSSYSGINKSMATSVGGKSAVLHIGVGAYNYEANYIIKNIKVIQSDHITINTSLQSSYSLPPLINISSATAQQLLVKSGDNIIVNKQGIAGFNYNINFDKIWDLYNDGDVINTGINNDEVKIQFNKSYIKKELYNNVYTNKDIVIDYTINPSYNDSNIALQYIYNITLDGEVLLYQNTLTDQITQSSISVPYNKLIKADYKDIIDRNLVINKTNNSTGEIISFNIPIKINPKRLFSKYFNGTTNYITIKNWTKPLSELVIQVVKKSSTDSDFIVSTDNTLVSLSGTDLKIGGISSFIGNIYEVRVWGKSKEQSYTYDQLYGDEEGLYALYRLNEYNSKNIYDSTINKLHGVYTGNLLNQDIVPSNSNYLTTINSSIDINDIVQQKEDYEYNYSIQCKKASYRNVNIGVNEISLPLNNLSILQNLFIKRDSWDYDSNYTVGQSLTQPERGWKRIDDRNTNIKYGSYYYPTAPLGAYNDTVYHNEKSSYIQFKFKGRGLRVIAQTGSSYKCDNIKITIDSDIYYFNTMSYNVRQCIVFEKILPNTIHTVTVDTREYKLYYTFDFDAIDINEDGYMIPIS